MALHEIAQFLLDRLEDERKSASDPDCHVPHLVIKQADVIEAIAQLHHPVRADGELACWRCGTYGEYPVPFPCQTLRLLLSLYSHYSGYRPEWKPDE